MKVIRNVKFILQKAIISKNKNETLAIKSIAKKYMQPF